MKVAIVGNNTSDILNARGNLIRAFIKNGHEVIAIGNEDSDMKKIEEFGAKPINIEFDRISISILKNLKYINTLTKVLKKEKIDKVLLYTPKPIICGSIAAKRAKIKNIYSLFAGMGYHYSINTFKSRVIKFVLDIGYRMACKIDTRVIFQNKEDREELIRKRFVKQEKAFVVDGSGVDMNKFIKTENKIESMDRLKFLMISRGLNVKGIKELSTAAKEVHKKYPNVKFTHIGKIEDTYRDITLKEKQEYSREIEFCGKVDNVYDYIKECNVVVLPSYLREGIPRVLLEGLAVGRPIITTNTRGCKETVINKKNGYLVNVKDSKDLVEKIILMIESLPEKIKQMSELSYSIAKERFDVNIINENMIKIMELNKKI